MKFSLLLFFTVFIAGQAHAMPRESYVEIFRNKNSINLTAKSLYRIYRLRLKKTSRPLRGKVFAIKKETIREKIPLEGEFFKGIVRGKGRASGTLFGKSLTINFEDKKRKRYIEVEAKNLSKKSSAKFRFTKRNGSPAFCNLDSISLASYSQSQSQSQSQSHEILITAIADIDFFNKFHLESPTKIERVFNFANTIYEDELGISIRLNNIYVYETEQDFFQSTNINTLLGTFRRAGNRLKPWGRADLFHLFTGKDLTPEGYVGLAYVGAACLEEGKYSYGLTKWVTTPIFPVITTHEIAHNLNATHTTHGIMQADLSGNPRTFSDFSKEEVSLFIEENGSCLSPLGISAKLANLTSNGAFKESIQIEGTSPKRCSLRLFLGENRSELRIGVAERRASLIARKAGVTVGDSFEFSARPRKSQPSLALFSRGVLSCGKTSIYTEITPIRVRAESFPWLVRYLSKVLAG